MIIKAQLTVCIESILIPCHKKIISLSFEPTTSQPKHEPNLYERLNSQICKEEMQGGISTMHAIIPPARRGTSRAATIDGNTVTSEISMISMKPTQVKNGINKMASSMCLQSAKLAMIPHCKKKL